MARLDWSVASSTENCRGCWWIWEGPAHYGQWHSWEGCPWVVWSQQAWENNSISSLPAWFLLQFLCGFPPWLLFLMNPWSVGWNEPFPFLSCFWLMFITAGNPTGTCGSKLIHQFSTVVAQYPMISTLISNLTCECWPCEISALGMAFWSL